MKDHSIIFFPLVDWDDPWQRYQHFASLFSKENRVIYINSPAAITYFFRNPLNLFRKWLRFIRGKKRISSKLSIYDPFPCLPFGRGSRWVNRLNQYILFLYIKLFVRPKGRLIVWINNPYYSLMTRLLKPEIAVYDCPDAIVFKNSRKRQRIYDELKKEVLQESTVSLFTSKALLEEGQRFSNNCFYVPNGVDVQDFNQTGNQRPGDMRGLTGRILGVVGTFDERIDVALMSFVLENVRNVTLALVGPILVNMGELADHPRVFIAGKRRYEEIPAFVEAFDVALIPYRLNEVTRAVYPVKLHEYLILGKPVVATNLPELEQFSDIIWIAKTKEEFAEYIGAALNESQEGIRRKRMDRAKANSWDARINQITEILHNNL
jgi:glycosyltransferase involved in cell wall biosynthesis